MRIAVAGPNPYPIKRPPLPKACWGEVNISNVMYTGDIEEPPMRIFLTYVQPG